MLLSKKKSYLNGAAVFFSLLYPDSIGGIVLQNNETAYHGQSTGESTLQLVATILGSSISGLLCLSGVLWFALRYRRKRSR